MDYKNQHFVTQAYLKAWCDPKTPKEYEPYVWIVSKKDRLAKKKSPKKIFKEADFYTFTDSKGNRNIGVEKWLQKIESNFIHILHEKIFEHKPLDDSDMSVVSAFIATMFARVPIQRDQQVEMWQEALDEINKSPKEVIATLKESGTYDQIINLKNQPLPYNIVNFANMAVPFFSQMSCEIFETESEPGFITSDNPCFMIDLALFTQNPPMSWIDVFSSSTFEILFPLSPKYLISIKPKGPDQYTKIDKTPEAMDSLNQVIVGNSGEFIVLNQKDLNHQWFTST
jgi:hypothetical protein